MTQEDVIKLAREAGVEMSFGEHWAFFIEELKAFAKLVAEHEREACAKVCDSWTLRDSLAADMAKEIRARGQA